MVSEVFQSDLEKAKTKEQRSALAGKLLQTGKETKNDDSSRFVLFRFARDTAVRGGDHQAALSAIDVTAEEYAIDALLLKASAIAEIAKQGRTGPEAEQLANQALTLVDQAAAADRFDVAGQFSKCALEAARNARNPKLLSQFVKRDREIDEAAKAFAGIQESLAVLNRDPVNAAANLAVGRFRCFVVDQWNIGIPMLALGSDADLKQVATAEIQGAKSPSDLVKLGDAWWDLAEKGEKQVAAAARRRAGHWYALAAPALTGLAKVRVEQRLQEIVPMTPSNTPAKGAKK